MGREPYAQLRNRCWRNPKIARVVAEHPQCAAWWFMSISYCSDQNNDGRFSIFEAVRFIGATEDMIPLMVGLRLWDEDGDGLRVHDYLDIQTPSERRESPADHDRPLPMSNAERQKRHRERRKAADDSPSLFDTEEPEGVTESNDAGVTRNADRNGERNADSVTRNEDRNEDAVTAVTESNVTRNVTRNAGSNGGRNADSVTRNAAGSVTRNEDAGVTRNEKSNDQSKSKSKSNNPPISPQGEPVGLADFRDAYPKHGNRAKLAQAWREVTAGGADPAMLVACAREYAKQCRAQSTPERYIPMPANFLLNGKWMDYRPKRPAGPPRYEMPAHEHSAGCSHVMGVCAPYASELSTANPHGPGSNPWFRFRDMVAKHLNAGDDAETAVNAALESATA